MTQNQSNEKGVGVALPVCIDIEHKIEVIDPHTEN